MENVWLSSDIFSWDARSEGGSLILPSFWKRSYDIWKRACDLIEKNDNSFDLCDGIANLKRSLNHRLILIEDLYNFKTISFPNKPKGYLELLELIGIVRPLIMKNLIEIRNNIEHKDKEPPNVFRCKELVDILWYFLRSTDVIVQIQRGDVYYVKYDDHGNETHYSFTLELDYETHTSFTLSGWYPSELISYNEQDNFYKLQIIDSSGKEIWNNTNDHQDKLVTDKWIHGIVNIDKSMDYINVIKSALSAY